MDFKGCEDRFRDEERGGEEILVIEAQQGSLKAFDTLARRYRSGAVLLARQIVTDSEAAEDAAQDALLAAYKHLPSLRDPSQFGFWLGAIVRNRAKRIGRSLGSAPLPIDTLLLEHAPSISGSAESHVITAEIRSITEMMAPELRAVVALYYFESWSVAQIAAFTGLTPATVKWRLHTARKELRARFSHLNEK